LIHRNYLRIGPPENQGIHILALILRTKIPRGSASMIGTLKTNMKSKILLLLAAAVAATAIQVHAVPISQWTFEPGVQTPAFVDPNATASNFTLSAGGVTFPSGNAPTATTAISGIGWNVSDGVKWWEFTVTANVGYALNLTTLTFDDRRSATGATGWSVTVNGITVISSQPTHLNFSGGPMNTVDLSAIALSNSTIVKIFGFGASGSTGTWRLDNVTLNGAVAQVQTVPDSLSFSFTGCFLLGFLAFSHYKLSERQEKPAF